MICLTRRYGSLYLLFPVVGYLLCSCVSYTHKAPDEAKRLRWMYNTFFYKAILTRCADPLCFCCSLVFHAYSWSASGVVDFRDRFLHGVIELRASSLKSIGRLFTTSLLVEALMNTMK